MMCFISYKAKCSHIRIVSDILTDFGQALGLIVNMIKSKVLCSKGVYSCDRRKFSDICLIAIVCDLGKCLGFRLKSGRATYERFQVLLD